MSFEELETSDDLGTPVEIYKFTYGPGTGDVIRYTNADRDITVGGEVYTAVPLSRENYKSSGKVDKTSMNIRVPESSDLGILFTEYPPTQQVTILAWAGHLDDPDEQYYLIWTGRVLSVAKENNESILTCDSTIISLKRPGLKRNWQYGCPLVLYGNTCKASMNAATRYASVASVVNGVITFTGGWLEDTAPEKFLNGMISWTGPYGTEYRTIRSVTSDGQITFVGPARGLVLGMGVRIILGCNHQMDDCINLHNNINNYGGQPWIPTKNPVKFHPFW